jgi:hypothetical protein
MATLSPMMLLSLLKNGNPQEVATQIIQNNFPNDPMMQNLLQWGQKGDINSLQQFAEQFFNQRGRNLNQEMQGLMDSIKKS